MPRTTDQFICCIIISNLLFIIVVFTFEKIKLFIITNEKKIPNKKTKTQYL